MSRFADNLLAKIQMLEIRLHCCTGRLADSSDAEALHDLRINLRTLRSLLRPLRGLPAIDLLEQAASDLGQLTNPMRELQVLAAELARRGMNAVAAEYTQALEPAFLHLVASKELSRLFEVLDEFPRIWRISAPEGCLRGLRRRIRRQFKRDLRRIPKRLENTEADLHALRLKVKRLRYCSQAYADLTPLGPRQLKLLRKIQQSLGDWNDCQYWLQCTAADVRLAALSAEWLARGQVSVSTAEVLFKRFRQSGK